MSNSIRIWDLPTRLFHWALVICVVGLVITGNVGGNAMTWHFRLGYTVITLVIFRIIWGFVGGHYSRFVNFFPTPGAVLRYLKGQSRPDELAGHNPLGACSVLMLLLLMCAQPFTGLFSYDDIAFAGPLSGLVSDHTVKIMSSLHTGLIKYLIIAFVALHVLAIIFYTLKKHHLVWPMVVGNKKLEDIVPPSRESASSRLLALVIVAVVAACVYALVTWGNAQGTAGGGY